MKKYVFLVLAVATLAACSSSQKSAYKSVDQRDVPEKYLKDFLKQRPDVKDVRWEMADSNTYFANFHSEDNECIMKFTRTSTGTYYVIPNEYIPSDITDYVKANYAEYKLTKAYITDFRNVKGYEIRIANKKEIKKLQFDLKGNFNKVID